MLQLPHHLRGFTFTEMLGVGRSFVEQPIGGAFLSQLQRGFVESKLRRLLDRGFELELVHCLPQTWHQLSLKRGFYRACGPISLRLWQCGFG